MSINYYKDVARLKSLGAKSTGAYVLYSGYGAKEKAEVLARQIGAKTISDIEAGRYLQNPNRYEQYSLPKADALWKKNSNSFIINLDGPVRTIVVGARAERVFRSVELHRLVRNSLVPTINGVDRQKVYDFYNKEIQAAQHKGLDRLSALKVAADRTHRLISITELRLNQREIRQGLQNPKQIRQHHESRQVYLAQKIDEAKARAKAMGVQYKGPELKPKQQRREELFFKTNRDVARSKGMNEAQAKQYADKKLEQYKQQRQSKAEQNRVIRARRNKVTAKHRKEVQAGRRDSPKDIRKQYEAKKAQDKIIGLDRISSKSRKEIRQFFAENRAERTKAREARKAGDLKPLSEANKKLADFKKQHLQKIADKSLKNIQARDQQRADFRQDRAKKMADLKQQKSQARESGDRAKIIEARKNATKVVKDLRAQNSQHARQKGDDQRSKVRVEQRLSSLRGQDGQQAQKKGATYTSQVKDGVLKTQFTATQDKAASLKTRREEAAQIVKDKSIKSVNGYDRTRFEKVYDRAYNSALRRGAGKDNAREAAQDRVSHVMGKVELLQDRARLKQNPEKKQVQEYFGRDAQFRDQRVKDLQAQASREKRDYKGPVEKPEGLRKVEAKISAREFTTFSNLDINAKKQGWTPSEYRTQYSTRKQALEGMRGQDYNSYFVSSQTSAQSYGISYKAPSATKGSAQSKDRSGLTQSHHGRGMSH